MRQARQELISAGLGARHVLTATVPDVVARSWRRSFSSGVNGSVVCQRYEEVDLDSELTRAATPVLDRWQHQLTDTGSTLFLCDRAGRIVARRTSDQSERRRLDRVHAAEGFDYSEDSVGTNGLGTSMVERRPVLIMGTEHYNEALSSLACAAAPVSAPTGSVIGSISLGAPLPSGNSLMLSLTREIGQQIEERLKAQARPQDLALAMSFMRYTNSQRPTVVMNHESLLANNAGLPYVDVGSHVVLWDQLLRYDWGRSATAVLTVDGTGIEVTARRIVDGNSAHYVLHFAERPDASTSMISPHAPPLVPYKGAAILAGPSGTGRATEARQLLRGRAAPLHELSIDPTSSRQNARPSVRRDPAVDWPAVERLLDSGSDVLLRRVEQLNDDEAAAMQALLRRQLEAVAEGQRGTCLLLTCDTDQLPHAVATALAHLPTAGRTRPLAETRERIPGLVKRLLDQADTRRRLTLSPAALQTMMQYPWPGDIAELAQIITDLVRDVPVAVIQRHHLPTHLQQGAPGRQWTLMESAERDAIARALSAARGNKSEAAQLLGIGRTTLYRRLRQLGLTADEQALDV